MEWDEKLQRIISCIESSLDYGERAIDEKEIEEIAGCSYAFFQKVFSYINGISLSEYIRLRKLTFAGYDLKGSCIRIAEVSNRYGYESPTSFTKAFRRFHGVSPREARKHETRLQIYPQMEKIRKQQYSWNIQTKEEIWPAGVSDNKNEWQHSVMIVLSQQLESDFKGGISLGEVRPSIRHELRNVSEYKLSGHTWAIIECRGEVPHAIQNGWKYLKGEWLPRHSFQYGECPAVEWYGEGNPKDKDYVRQIWIPIII